MASYCDTVAEVYESLRQIMDDFAGFEGAFFIFAGRPDLIHDEKGDGLEEI